MAVVLLTRRDDLAVERERADRGFDILVDILRDGKPSGRVFGVEVKGTSQADRNGHPDANRQTRISAETLQPLRDLPFPVCLFLFEMETDRSWYGWLKEPDADPSRPRELILHPTLPLAPLGNEQLNEIVDRVNAWYEHRVVTRDAA
jgi:hypothetical protein